MIFVAAATLAAPFLLALATLAAAPAFAQSGEVNVYTTREPGLIQPLLDAFTEETGIKANTIFVESGLAERLEAEGANSPADVISVVDYGNSDRPRRPRPDAAGRVGGARRGGAGEPARSGRATGTRSRCAPA